MIDGDDYIPPPSPTVNERVEAATQAPIFGPLVSEWTIERAAIATLQKWLYPTYIQAIEEQESLMLGTISKPGGIFGASDTTQWDQGLSPAVMVVCDTVDSAPERYQSVGYSQAFTLVLAAIVQDDEPTRGRMHAGLYGAAIMGVIGQQLAGDNPGTISNVVMTAAPKTAPAEEDVETILLTQMTFSVTAAPILVDTAGPLEPVALDGDAPPWPVVTSPGVSVTAEDLPTS